MEKELEKFSDKDRKTVEKSLKVQQCQMEMEEIHLQYMQVKKMEKKGCKSLSRKKISSWRDDINNRKEGLKDLFEEKKNNLINITSWRK